MNLVKFLFIFTLFTIILGEFGKYPFGLASQAVSLTDITLTTTLIFFAVWKFGVEKEKIKLPRPYIILVGFLGVGLLSLFISGNLSGIFYLIRFFVFIQVFLISYFLIKDKFIKLYDLAKIVVLAGIIISITGFLQLIFYPDLKYFSDFGYDPHIGRLSASFLDPNFVGGFLNLCLVCLVPLRKRLKPAILIVLGISIISAVIFTFSRSAYLQLLIQLFVIGLFLNRKILLFLIIIPVILYFSVPRFAERISGAFKVDVTSKERIQSWEKGWSVIKSNPLVGVGFNNLRSVSVENNLIKSFSPDGGHSGAGVDSSLLFTAATTGFTGLAVYLFFIFFNLYAFFKSLVRNIKFDFGFVPFVITIGLLAHSFFVNSLYFPPIMLYWFSILGASYAEIED